MNFSKFDLILICLFIPPLITFYSYKLKILVLFIYPAATKVSNRATSPIVWHLNVSYGKSIIAYYDLKGCFLNSRFPGRSYWI